MNLDKVKTWVYDAYAFNDTIMSLFSVERSIRINAKVEDVFEAVANFEVQKSWSPWLIMEPNCSVDFKGIQGQEGAVHIWDGEWIGSGELEHKKLIKNQRIEDEARFLKPWKSRGEVYWDFNPDGHQTVVTWGMKSSLPLVMFWMKRMMEAWVGMDYERGLRMLKEYSETGTVTSKVAIEGIVETKGFSYIGRKNTCSIEELGPAMEQDFKALEKAIDEHGLQTTGTVFSIYHKFDMVQRKASYTSGISVSQLPSNLDGFVMGSLDGGKALKVVHTGSYLHLGNGWSAMMSYQRYKKLKCAKGKEPLEIYENNSANTPPEKLITSIYCPLKN